METLKNGNYPTLLTKLEEEGEVVIPTAVTLAYVLEKMTQTMKQNWRFTKVCNQIWSQFDDISKIIEFSRVDGNLFTLVKVLTLQQVIKRDLKLDIFGQKLPLILLLSTSLLSWRMNGRSTLIMWRLV